MKNLKLFIFLLLLSFSECENSKGQQMVPNIKGTWNSYPSDNISNLEISEAKTFFEFGCATAEINSPITVRKGTINEFKGIFQRGRPVIPVDYNPKDDQREARFQFALDDEILNVSIIDTKDGSKIGDFKYKKGTPKNIVKCL
jgi:hypothetical protein